MLLRRVPPARQEYVALQGSARQAADSFRGRSTCGRAKGPCRGPLCNPRDRPPPRSAARCAFVTHSGLTERSGFAIPGSTLPLAASMRLVLACVPSSARRKPEPTPACKTAFLYLAQRCLNARKKLPAMVLLQERKMAVPRGCWGGLFIAERMKDFRTSRMDAARGCVLSSARRKPEPIPPPARPHFFIWRSVVCWPGKQLSAMELLQKRKMAVQRGGWGGLFIAERMRDFRTSRMDAARGCVEPGMANRSRSVRNPEYARAPRSGDEAGREPGVKRARRLAPSCRSPARAG